MEKPDGSREAAENLEYRTILAFLQWAAGHHVHLASQGRPPFGRQGTWFMSQYEHPEFVEAYLGWKRDQERNSP